ncbi:MAG: TonB-dependent receptor [Gemmatimonadales bacterium]|nr:MAG: TonB-dependent receptor [Gemmatimonadales bacterium]
MQGVVVSARGFEQSILRAPASISVVDGAALFQGQVRSISEAVEALPGVDIDGTDARSNKTGARTISLRGLPSEYTLILIDGRRQNVPGTVAPNAFNDSGSSFLPPLAAIERIEVIRGPMSTLYGSDALGGVVNIITRRGGERWVAEGSVDGTLQGDADFGGSRAFEGYASGPLVSDRLSLTVQARRFDRAPTRVSFPGQDTSVDRQRTMGQLPTRGTIETAGGQLSFSPSGAHEFHLGADATRQRFDNEFGQLGQVNGQAQPGTPGFPDRLQGYDQELGFNRDQLYAGHRVRYARGYLQTSVSANRTETTGRTVPAGAATPESGRRGTPRTLASRILSADSRYTAFLGDHTLTVGGEYLEAQLTDGIPDDTFTSGQTGIFAENEWRAASRLRLTAGLRYDNHSGFGGQLSPRGYAVFTAAPDWTLKGGVARGYRAPALEQLHDGIIGFGNNGRDPLFGNPDLRPETSTNWEASVLYSGLEAGSATLTLFRTNLSNKIERPVAATGGETANVGTALLQGLEVAGRIEPVDGWTLGGEYTYTRSEVTTSEVRGIREGEPLFGVPAHMVNARVRWTVTPSLDATLGGQFRSSRHRPDSFHEPHLGGSAQGAAEALGDFRGYGLMNVGLGWQLNRHLQLNASVENLLDKNFVDYRPYPLRNNPETIVFSNVYNNILEPRRLWLSLRATL